MEREGRWMIGGMLMGNEMEEMMGNGGDRGNTHGW